jgi:hypothetical protein
MQEWGGAKVEFLALWPEIKTQLEAGKPLRRIYSDLSDAGRITMSERAFYTNRRKIAELNTGSRIPPSPPKTVAFPAQQKSFSTAIERTGGIRFVTEAPRVASKEVEDDNWGPVRGPDNPDAPTPPEAESIAEAKKGDA